MRWLIVFSVLFSYSTAVFSGAGRCNDKHPAFIVDGKEIWQGAKVSEIFEKAEKKEVPKAKKVNATGIMLADLVKPYATQGTLLIKTCGKRSESFKVEELFSDDKNKSFYFLAKTKKKSFKLLHALGKKKPKPVLKRVQTIELISRSPDKKQAQPL